jgi:hypothetical protein
MPEVVAIGNSKNSGLRRRVQPVLRPVERHALQWLDLVALFEALLRSQDNAELQAIRFFTAPAPARFASHGQTSVEAQHRYHRALENFYSGVFSITLRAHSMDPGGALLPFFERAIPTIGMFAPESGRSRRKRQT